MSTQSSPFYLGGEWRRASDERGLLPIHRPYDGSLLGNVSLAAAEDLQRAVDLAETGFESMRRLQGYQRHEALTAIAQGLRERKEEIAALITDEVGKPLSAARVEVERSIMTFELSAEESRRIGGEVVPLDITRAGKDKLGIVRRFPRGIVLAITPFNFPLNLVAHKVGPALAAGNSVILKPSPQGTLTSLKLAEVIDGSGLPKGAFSVLPCTNDLAESLVTNERLAMVSFTGSAAVGWRLKGKAGRKKVVLELGGNAGVIVDSTADLAQAVRKNVLGAFVYSGQVCIKVQRIYVHNDIFDKYVAAFVKEARTLVSGDPRNEEVVVGPVIDSSARDRILRWIDEAEGLGAKLLLGGSHKGNIIDPTILTDVPRQAQVFCSEIFGPVVTLHRFSSIKEAVDGINDSAFGLQAGIFTNDFKQILFAYEHLQVGAVIVNDNPTFRVDNMPYGGIKQSGFGREGVRYAIEEMTEPKLLALGI